MTMSAPKGAMSWDGQKTLHGAISHSSVLSRLMPSRDTLIHSLLRFAIYWEGIGIGTVLLPKMMETVGEDVATHGILAREGMECISRILALPDAQVMVSTSDYPALVEELQRNAKNVLKNYAAFQAKAKVAKRPQLAVPP